MIDTHCHINTSKFDEDRDDVISHAFESGVEKIIIPAIEPNDFDGIMELVNKYENVFCGIGIHPHNVANVTDKDLDKVKEYCKKDKVVAIGEIGVDYFYDFAPKEKQLEIFDKQIKIALNNNLPIIVHNREADDDILQVIENNQNGALKGVMHCFSSDINVLRRTLDLGFNVSFTGNITFKKVDMVNVLEYVPLDRFMIETDSPYMAPVPHRGKRNEPAYVRFVAEKIAEVKKMSFMEIVNQTNNNAKKLFNLTLVLMTFLFLNNVQAQDDVYYEDSEESIVKDSFNAGYDKLFGFGFMFGTTTIVESRYIKEGTQTLSYEGFLGYGGEFSFTPFQNLQLRLGYVYSKNIKIQEDAKGIGIFPGNPNYPDPNIHQMYEITANYIPNPKNKINFFVVAGANLFINNLNKQKNQKLGISFGVGVIGNLWESPWGLLSVTGEFRVNTELSKENYNNVLIGKDDIRDNVGILNLISMPRFTLQFYPKLR